MNQEFKQFAQEYREMEFLDELTSMLKPEDYNFILDYMKEHEDDPTPIQMKYNDAFNIRISELSQRMNRLRFGLTTYNISYIPYE